VGEGGGGEKKGRSQKGYDDGEELGMETTGTFYLKTGDYAFAKKGPRKGSWRKKLYISPIEREENGKFKI